MTPTSEPVRVAMFLTRKSAPVGEEAVYGRDIAVDSFLSALLRHGPGGEYRFYQRTGPTAPAAGDETVRRAAAGRSDIAATFGRFADLADGTEPPRFRVWHDLDGDLPLGVGLRQSCARSYYPVTGIPYVLSYPGTRHAWILRLLLADLQPCDAIIANSRATRETIQLMFNQVREDLQRSHHLDADFRGRLVVLPLGVDTDAFRPRSPARARAAFGLPPHGLVVLWLGRLSFLDKADLLPLVHAFAGLRSSSVEGRHAEPLLVVAGSGPTHVESVLMDYARRLGIADRMRVIRPVPPERRALLYAAADIFASPADNVEETFGLTPIEAMACGIPQVVSDWNGYRDAVQHGETGFLVPTWFPYDDSTAARVSGLYDCFDLRDHLMLAQQTAVDVDAMRAALQRLIDDPELRQRMSAASRQRAVSHFDWRVVLAGYEHLWQDLRGVADGLGDVTQRRRNYATPAFREAFGHYATSVLEPATPIVLTAAGRRVLRGDEVLPAYVAELRAISTELAQRALQEAEKLLPASFATLADSVDGRAGAHHVMWLLKHGLLRVNRAAQFDLGCQPPPDSVRPSVSDLPG